MPLRLTDDEALKMLLRQYAENHPEEFASLWPEPPSEESKEADSGSSVRSGCYGCFLLVFAIFGVICALIVGWDVITMWH